VEVKLEQNAIIWMWRWCLCSLSKHWRGSFEL